MTVANSATYAATKAYVTPLTQSLHEELRGSGVEDLSLVPRSHSHRFPGPNTADEMASAGLDSVAANRAIVVCGAKNKAAVTAFKMMPGAVKRRLSGMLAN